MGVNPAFQKIHHVEGSANDLTVFTQYASIGYRNGRVFSERAHNAVFPLHHVSRRQRLSRGLPPQYITPVAGIQQKGGIGLPALKLLHVHLVTEFRQCLLKPVEQAGFIEFVGWQNRYQLWSHAHDYLLSLCSDYPWRQTGARRQGCSGFPVSADGFTTVGNNHLPGNVGTGRGRQENSQAEIGRASCRERGEISVGAVVSKTKR